MVEISEVTIKQEIYNILMQSNKMGKRITREQIRSLILSRYGIDIPDRLFRVLYVDMIYDGYPVGSSATNGYFIIDSQEKYDEATNELKSKLISLNNRIKKLAVNVENKFGTHIQLELEIN